MPPRTAVLSSWSLKSAFGAPRPEPVVNPSSIHPDRRILPWLQRDPPMKLWAVSVHGLCMALPPICEAVSMRFPPNDNPIGIGFPPISSTETETQTVSVVPIHCYLIQETHISFVSWQVGNAMAWLPLQYQAGNWKSFTVLDTLWKFQIITRLWKITTSYSGKTVKWVTVHSCSFTFFGSFPLVKCPLSCSISENMMAN